MRGISDEVISTYELSWDGSHIVIPVHDIKGNHLFNKYRRDPESTEGPKYKYEAGASSVLYGLKTLNKENKMLVICEGELDCLRLLSASVQAISSTGGASTFKEGWAKYINENFEQIYICLDSDDAGIKGAFKIHAMIPRSKIIWIPKEYKDVTEFLQKSGKTFTSLLLDSESYLLPEDWKGAKTKKEMVAYERQYKTAIDSYMERARDVRAAYQSDKHLQYVITMFMNKFNEVKRAIKYFQVKRDDFNNDKLAQAKQVPIPQFIRFNNDNTACCIWHQEKTPSMHYYEKQNRVKCFGCDKLGDVIDVVQQLNQCNLSDAIKIILNEK